MTERGVVLFLITGTAVCAGGVLIWFLVGVRPRSVAVRLVGAAGSLLVLLGTALVVWPLSALSEAHASAASEGGTFFYGLVAELVVLAGALGLIASAMLWRSGIKRHPGPVSGGERATQTVALGLPIALYALVVSRCAWSFLPPP